jgi:hypothetical protein
MARKPSNHTSDDSDSKIETMTPRTQLIERVRSACSDLPEVEERPSHGAPTFFVRGKKSFLMLWADGHHDHDFPHLWCAATEGVQGQLVGSDPERFFRPPYVGHRGWVGIRLDRGFGDDELLEWAEDAYRAIAPATLVRKLDASAAE